MYESPYCLEYEVISDSDDNSCSDEIAYPEEEDDEENTCLPTKEYLFYFPPPLFETLYPHVENDEYNHVYTVQKNINEIPLEITKKVLPRFRSSGDLCSICLEDCNIYNKCRYCSIKCGNIFHSKCVHDLITYNKGKTTCPICRSDTQFLICDDLIVSSVLDG